MNVCLKRLKLSQHQRDGQDAASTLTLASERHFCLLHFSLLCLSCHQIHRGRGFTTSWQIWQINTNGRQHRPTTQCYRAGPQPIRILLPPHPPASSFASSSSIKSPVHWANVPWQNRARRHTDEHWWCLNVTDQKRLNPFQTSVGALDTTEWRCKTISALSDDCKVECRKTSYQFLVAQSWRKVGMQFIGLLEKDFFYSKRTKNKLSILYTLKIT